MKERIRELAKEARLLTGWTVGEVEYQKFAELIVREVFAKIEDERFEIYQPVKESVMKHFGVEE